MIDVSVPSHPAVVLLVSPTSLTMVLNKFRTLTAISTPKLPKQENQITTTLRILQTHNINSIQATEIFTGVPNVNASTMNTSTIPPADASRAARTTGNSGGAAEGLGGAGGVHSTGAGETASGKHGAGSGT